MICLESVATQRRATAAKLTSTYSRAQALFYLLSKQHAMTTVFTCLTCSAASKSPRNGGKTELCVSKRSQDMPLGSPTSPPASSQQPGMRRCVRCRLSFRPAPFSLQSQNIIFNYITEFMSDLAISHQ